MRHGLLAVLALLLLAPAASAQSRFFDLTGNFVWLDPQGGGTFDDLTDPADLEIDAEAGYGIAANVFFGRRLSAEFAVARIEPETRVRRRVVGGSGPGGNLQITPLTAVLQFHFAPDAFIDPYVGAGAAYVLYDFSASQGVHNLSQIDLKDDVGLALNAGVGIRLGQRFGLTLDGKYVPIESDATAVVIGTNQQRVGQFDVSPIIISAGLSLRF
jgi:outer membrane protein W